MTDILTRLAELTAKAQSGLLPCPFCSVKGQPVLWHKGNEHTKDRGCDVGCAECGFTKSIRVIRYSLHWAEERATASWNSRPRETALIALVQEARKEIERIRKSAQNVIDTFKIGNGIVKDGVPPFVANAIAKTALHELNQALNQQEPGYD